jgi:hypothetical protein
MQRVALFSSMGTSFLGAATSWRAFEAEKFAFTSSTTMPRRHGARGLGVGCGLMISRSVEAPLDIVWRQPQE